MDEWQEIDTIPLDHPVWVKTATGIECLAIPRTRSARWIRREDRWGPRRVCCYRLDGRTRGDVVAVKWREDAPPIEHSEIGKNPSLLRRAFNWWGR